MYFSPATFEEVFQYTLEPDSGEPAAVKDICPLTAIDRVAVSLANGRLFITRLVTTPHDPTEVTLPLVGWRPTTRL